MLLVTLCFPCSGRQNNIIYFDNEVHYNFLITLLRDYEFTQIARRLLQGGGGCWAVYSTKF